MLSLAKLLYPCAGTVLHENSDLCVMSVREMHVRPTLQAGTNAFTGRRTWCVVFFWAITIPTARTTQFDNPEKNPARFEVAAIKPYVPPPPQEPGRKTGAYIRGWHGDADGNQRSIVDPRNQTRQ